MEKYNDAQTIVLTGHYGSGKSEVAINFAIDKKEANEKTAILDLDIANPYFRSREKQEMLAGFGIETISNAYGHEITADLPALSPLINSYILNSCFFKVIDVGGNDSGARILNQYKASLKKADALILFVVNVYRPETDSAEKIIKMMESIENETGLKIDGIVNNSNLLKDTETRHILSSMDILKIVSERTSVPVVTTCCEQRHYHTLKEHQEEVFPIQTYLRPKWLDM